MSKEVERRYMDLKEIRGEKRDDGSMFIEGYPIVYGQEAIMYGAWKEIITRGAATKALARSNELVLWNHQDDQPMARRSNGTLVVTEDEHGVKIRADVSKTRWGRDGFEAIQSGTIDKMSFAFDIAQNGQTWARETVDGFEIDLRTITEFGQIYDYSPVSYPAYEGTEVQSRNKELAYRDKPPALEPEADKGARESESQAAEDEERNKKRVDQETESRERDLNLIEKGNTHG